jgi:ATP-dependent DNA helicase RecG
MLRLSDPVSSLGGLNAAQKRAIKAFDAQTIGDLLRLYPRRYDDYSHTTKIAEAPVGQPVTLRVRIKEAKKAPGFRRRITMIRAQVEDGSGKLSLIWFNQPWLLDALQPGREIFVSGTILLRPPYGRQMSNPIWEPVDSPAVAAGSVAPVYPLTGSVAQKTMRELLLCIIEQVEHIHDPLPESLRTRLSLYSLRDAYRAVHRPTSLQHAEEGRRRLAFDEFLIYRLALGAARHDADEAGAPAIPFDEPFAKRFAASLPFPLTVDQKKAAWAAFLDMKESRPMRRLMQGDVGSGKTVVACFLMAMVYRSGQSAVMMAPTELLAKQHAQTVRRFIEAEQIPLLLLTASEKTLWEGGEQSELNLKGAQERILQGRILVVGTHALLERGALPPDTALSIVDEQHRFGVAQRETLVVAPRPDGRVPHLLSMTATPIPRSLALTLYGDLAVSLIRTKPAGRRDIATRVLVGDTRTNAYTTIRKQVASGHRAFIVCPLIDPSDTLGVRSATEEAKRLASGPLSGLRIGLLHGKMSTADKDGVMKAFAEGLSDVLVATTVVEVGVDVPEATVMLIEAAERFGLAQLHQLRGRVGRSSHPSYCFLLTDIAGGPVLDRLRVLERTNNGFIIAEEDLKRRGEGNLLGTQQSGAAVFRAARSTDVELMAIARETAEELLRQDAELLTVSELHELVQQMRKTSHQE